MEGGKTTSENCIEKYEEYLNNPSEIEKHKLLLAYEEVPKHLRIYLLSMEEQDLPIREIIYGDIL